MDLKINNELLGKMYLNIQLNRKILQAKGLTLQKIVSEGIKIDIGGASFKIKSYRTSYPNDLCICVEGAILEF